MIYELKFFYWDDEPQNDDEVIIAVYSTYELAERGLEKFSNQPRFKGKKEAFNIIEHKINEENSTWSEGFIEFNPAFFKLELFGEYRIRKYDDEEIIIYDDDETQKFFAMKIQDYQDFEGCTILRNRELEKMYCFDKKEQSVSIETSNADEFAEFLRENYGIEKIRWELIFFEERK